jgi:mannose-6-phosphate isomerase
MKTLSVERPWGKFDQFTLNEKTTVKVITVKAGEQLSLQSHKMRSEFWRVLEGGGTVEIDGARHDAVVGGEYDIPIGIKHRAVAGPQGLVFLEIDKGEFDEHDEVRYQDKYGRA